MAIVVKPIDALFRIELTHDEEKISFDFKQLSYKTKAKITNIVTTVEQGQMAVDAALQVFFNIKHSLKAVEGLVDEEGNSYQLKFETIQKEELTDACVDELLATPFSNNLQFAASTLSAAVRPTEIVHPITKVKLEGIEIIPSSKKDVILKK